MQYDPIKRSLGSFFNSAPVLRKIFYHLLDLLLLRSWHIHKAFYTWARGKKDSAVHILDAGAGFGQYTYFMSGFSNKWNILSVDVKDEQVKDCNEFFQKIGRNEVVFKVADLTKFSDPEKFDMVLCVDVMEHILDDVGVFKNFYASMKKGAMLLISTPSDQGGSDVHEEGEGSFIEEHVRDGYNIHDIQKKLESAGFSIIEASYSYGDAGKISWKLSMKYPIKLLGFSKLFFVLLPFYYLLVYPLSFALNLMDVHGNHPTGTGLIVKAWK
jgi:2-polyprenyl-3-methyl-5-hydroxy-6-metoxy-1,4-benzoquinol methylase